MPTKRICFAFYEAISRKKKSKASDWVTEKSEAHNTQDQEGGGEPAKRRKQDNKGTKPAAAEEKHCQTQNPQSNR